MATPQDKQENRDIAPDFLTHLRWTFGWSEEQAIDALGSYISSTEAGRALRRALDSTECNRSVEAA
jgi:hypothetical protein